MSGYKKLSAITMSRAEYGRAKEDIRTTAEARRRESAEALKESRLAAQGIRMHPLDDGPWSEERFSPCTPGCKHWDGAA